MPVTDRAAALRQHLGSNRILTVPGAFDALSASIIERAGFDAIYATGAGITNARLGVPDLGLLTLPELVSAVEAMTDVTTIPLIVDIDTGFGGAHNAARAVRELEAVGTAAVQIEDQAFPKRCGHFEGKRVVPAEEMVEKIIAITDTRRHGLVLIARTDAIAIEGLDAALERAALYVDAGADMVFVEALETEEQIRRVPAMIHSPLLINMVEGGKTPFLPIPELEQLGYRIALFANFALRVAMQAMMENLALLRQAGTSADLMGALLPWEDRQATVGLAAFEALELEWKERAQRAMAQRSLTLRPGQLESG